jgi:hypothetical protein
MDTTTISLDTTHPLDLLNDPDRRTITIAQAAAILCVSVSTAYKHHRRTGYLMDGVPVFAYRSAMCG